MGIEPTSNRLRICCLTSRPGAHGALAKYRELALLISTIRFSKWPLPVGNADIGAVGGNRTRHSDLASRRVTMNTSTAEDTRVPRAPVGSCTRTGALQERCSAGMSYEGVSSRPPTDRTPLLGFGDQAGPRPWPRRSCSCVRRVCPASSLVRATFARCVGPRNGEGPGTFRFTGPRRDPVAGSD